jgi:hypothetical protein
VAKPHGKPHKNVATTAPSETETNSSHQATPGDSGGEATFAEQTPTLPQPSLSPNTALNPAAKKEMKPKKPLSAKTGSFLPSTQKLDHMKAAVKAAGNADNLVIILQHVEEAGGYKEVIESVEAYKVLKTVLED